MANSVDPDETPHSAASHLGLYCLLRPVCPNIYGKYGTLLLHYVSRKKYTNTISYLEIDMECLQEIFKSSLATSYQWNSFLLVLIIKFQIYNMFP